MSSSAKKRILLAGGGGYLGTQLSGLLAAAHTVVPASRTGKSGTLQLDFLQPSTFGQLRGPFDLVVILASSMKGLGSTALREEFLETDTKGLPAFLQYLSDHALTKAIIYISSMTVYGAHNPAPVAESGALQPLSTYGLSKVLSEKILEFHCRSGAAKGATLRIPGIYGGNRKSGFVYNTAVKCRSNTAIELDTGGLGYWETMHIDDLCTAISAFIEAYDWQQDYDVFNIGYGVPTDIIECAQHIKDLLGSSSEIRLKGEKGYSGLYLDPSKIKRYIAIENNYLGSLAAFVKQPDA